MRCTVLIHLWLGAAPPVPYYVEVGSYAMQKRKAFTLVELLVVIAIIAMLVTLLLPAVQAARAAARRTQCINQIRQLALGALNFESANRRLPGGTPYRPIRPNVGQPPSTPAHYHTMGWIVETLPFVEEQALFDVLACFPRARWSLCSNPTPASD